MSLRSRTSPRSRALALTVAGLLMLFGLTAGPAAQAHDQLVGSNPEEGAELDEQPQWIEMDFSGEIQDVGTEVQVLQDGGDDVSAGEVTVEGTQVSSALPDDLTPGTYTVQWRVVSSDGHPISGEFDFTLTDAVGAGQDGEGDEAAQGEDGDGAAELGGAAVDQPEDGAQDQGSLSEDADSSGLSTPMMILLGVGGLAIVVLIVMLLTRKQKGLPGTPGNPETGDKPAGSDKPGTPKE